uniref:Uncharacterized protein n=1 Tax=viral metagenome TaxID=1070528 RepID=A0A6C0CL91_9ZZZZ
MILNTSTYAIYMAGAVIGTTLGTILIETVMRENYPNSMKRPSILIMNMTKKVRKGWEIVGKCVFKLFDPQWFFDLVERYFKPVWISIRDLTKPTVLFVISPLYTFKGYLKSLNISKTKVLSPIILGVVVVAGSAYYPQILKFLKIS